MRLIFPKYNKDHSPKRRITRYRLNKTKIQVKKILRSKGFAQNIIDACSTLGKTNISIQFSLSYDRICGAQIAPNLDCHGQCDRDTIEIDNRFMNDTFLLGTLLHETMHYLCLNNSRYMSENIEHHIMFALGEISTPSWHL